MFDFLKKKGDKTKELKELFQKEVYKDIESSQQTQFTQQVQPVQQIVSSQHMQQDFQLQPSVQKDRLDVLESKIENLRIYLEMINSKLDRLEALLRAKGLV